MELRKVRVAFVTDDGKSIYRHFGRAKYFLIVDYDKEGKIKKEVVSKSGCQSRSEKSHDLSEEEVHLGNDERHEKMSEPLEGCSAIISGGMGMGAFKSLMLKGISPIITDEEDIEKALKDYLEGKLENHLELLH
uniref:Dinitrogenase iron-molybdenum cofactor biosynthesis protein n=1 Tax=Candidatus Methanomethylicus mesodigestus TaxID=1867258 RepID=A0A7C3J4Z8_9CREN